VGHFVEEFSAKNGALEISRGQNDVAPVERIAPDGTPRKKICSRRFAT
jgi:hypothetical protein